VEADKVRIFQVISNLLSNAIKFTDKQGAISISKEEEKRQRLLLLLKIRMKKRLLLVL
jgi:signal transduction histidine kinase